LSRYNPVTNYRGWRKDWFFTAFSGAIGRISYIVGYKPDFFRESKISEGIFYVYIDGKLR